ncbi:hypothetical protein HYX07_05690 [Candidatus Woesearchaeota archaeon]|nr:hypothetical protein [Candidatus Woesearchaeota archaeon]
MPKSVFLHEEGNTPKNRVWSFLIVHSEYDYSMKDIARYSGVGYTTLKEIWKEFKGKKIVVQTRAVGKAKMYRLNLKNPVVNKFIDYYWAVVESVVKRENKFEEEENVYHISSSDAMPVSARNT